MAAYPTKLAEAFASKALQIYYTSSVAEDITNQDYEGEIKDKGSIVNILTFSKILSKNYTGSNLTPDDLTESNAQLITDQAKAFYFRVKSYDKFRSYIKNPEGTILTQTASELKKVIDTFVLGFWTKVGAGNRLGTNYTTGTVTVAATTGVVTGSGTTFTSAMVGKPFKANGHTQWYLVTAFTSTTSITISDDLDDSGAGAYTGGALGPGVTYIIQANTAVQVTASTVFDQLNQLDVMLDDQEIPAENRFVVVPPAIAALIKESANFNPSGVPQAYDMMTREGWGNGRVGGKLAGFEVYQSPRVVGDSVNGWHMLAGHKSAITFAMGFTETGMEDLIGNFGKAYKSLNVYGAKVPDERRKALAELFGKL